MIGKQTYTQEDDMTHARGMTAFYWTLVLAQIGAAISTSTKTQNVFGRGGYGFPNRPLNCLLLLEIVLALNVMYRPSLNEIFITAPLSTPQLLLPLRHPNHMPRGRGSQSRGQIGSRTECCK